MFLGKRPLKHKIFLTDQIKILKVKARTGAKKYKNKLTWFGMTISLENSLIPSARGCNKPYTPTTLGPFLVWVYPNIFLPAKVR